MAPKDPNAEAEEKELTDEEKKKRAAFLEMLRQMAAQQGQPQPGAGRGPQPEPDIAGFAVTEDTLKKQISEEAEKAKQGPQQQPHSDLFLQALARVYGVPPQSFEPEFAKVFVATNLEFAEQDKVVGGKFSSAGHNLPVVEVTKQYAITKGGQMTPELAMHLAMIAMSNPDMARDGVEIKGKTEEDKLLLLAAAKAIGLKVKNEADIKIDSEPQMQDRFQRCQQARSDLSQWAAAGPTAPASQNQAPGKKDTSNPAADAAAAAATGAAAQKLVDDSNKPGADSKDKDKDKDEPPPQKWGELSPTQKNDLIAYFRDNSSRFDNMSEEDTTKEIASIWDGLNAKQQANYLNRAKAAAMQRKPAEEPAQTAGPVFEGLRTDDQKKMITEYLRDQHPEYDLSDEDWEKQAADIWNGKDLDERRETFKNALAESARLEEKAAKRREEAKKDAGKTEAETAAPAKNDQANNSSATTAETTPAKPGLTAPPAPAEPPAPQLAPMNERKYADLLPEEKKLLEADELAARNAGKKKKATKLSEDAQKLLESEWNRANADENKARIEKITGDLNNATAALVAQKAREAEQQRLLAAHGKALAKLHKDHDKAVKEFEQAMAARDPDAPLDAPTLKPVEKRTFDQLLPAEKKALRNLAEATRPDKDRNKAQEMWDDPNLTPEARKERFDHATAGDANAKLRKEIEREQKKARKVLVEAQARAAAAAATATAKPADTTPVVANPPDTTKSGPDEDDGTQKPVVPKAPDNPNPDISAQLPPVAAPVKDAAPVTPVSASPEAANPAADSQTPQDQTPAKVDPPKPEIKPVKGLRSFDQLSQPEQDALWEYMTVTEPRPANPDRTPYSKQQMARWWSGLPTVGRQIAVLDFVRKENAKARDAIAKNKADRNDEHSQLTSKDFSQLLLAERHLLEEDFAKRKPEGVASAEAEWNSLDAKGRSNHITLAELSNPELGDYVERARRLPQVRFTPHKYDDLLPEERQVLDADFEKRKPDGVASAKAEWDAMDERHQDFHIDRALVQGGELTEPVLDARKKAREPKPEVKVEAPAPTPASPPKQRGKFRELVASFLHAINPWASQTTPQPSVERKEPVLTLPPAETSSNAAGETAVNASDSKPAAVLSETAAAAPGVDDASKKKFAALLEQEQKMLLVDYLARNGSAMGNAWEQEWDSAADDGARAKLFNEAWRSQAQMHKLVIADQEALKAPPAPKQDLTPPAPSSNASDADGINPPVVVMPPTPPKPAEPAALNARNWDQLSSTEQDVLRTADSKNANIASDWNSWDAQTRDEMYGVALLEKTEREAKAAAAVQQTAKPVVAETPPALPPVVQEAEKLDMPPETDTEFDAALQAKGHSRADLAGMGVEQARDLIATIRKEQEAKQAAKPPVAETRTEAAPVVVDPPAPVELPKQSFTSTFNITVDRVKTLPPSEDAIKILANNGFKDEKYQKAYQAIRAEVVEQQARCPGFHVSRKFLSQAANNAQLDEVLGHKGLDPKEQNAMLECLRKEGVTTGKGPAVRDQNFGASNWDKNLATHYPQGPTSAPT